MPHPVFDQDAFAALKKAIEADPDGRRSMPRQPLPQTNIDVHGISPMPIARLAVAMDADGEQNALFLAVELGAGPRWVKALLSAGASPIWMNHVGATPVFMAYKSVTMEIMRFNYTRKIGVSQLKQERQKHAALSRSIRRSTESLRLITAAATALGHDEFTRKAWGGADVTAALSRRLDAAAREADSFGYPLLGSLCVDMEAAFLSLLPKQKARPTHRQKL